MYRLSITSKCIDTNIINQFVFAKSTLNMYILQIQTTQSILSHTPLAHSRAAHIKRHWQLPGARNAPFLLW